MAIETPIRSNVNPAARRPTNVKCSVNMPIINFIGQMYLNLTNIQQ